MTYNITTYRGRSRLWEKGGMLVCTSGLSCQISNSCFRVIKITLPVPYIKGSRPYIFSEVKKQFDDYFSVGIHEGINTRMSNVSIGCQWVSNFHLWLDICILAVLSLWTKLYMGLLMNRWMSYDFSMKYIYGLWF